MVIEVLKNYRTLLHQTRLQNGPVKVESRLPAFSPKDVVPVSATKNEKNVFGRPAEKLKYVAPENGKVYHNPGCNLIKNVSSKKMRKFSSAEEARRAGYFPCPHCQNLPDTM